MERDFRGVQTIIIARGDSAVENPQVQNYRDNIHTEYDGLIVKMSGARNFAFSATFCGGHEGA